MYLTEWVQGSRYSVQSMWLKHSFPLKEPCVSWGCSLIWRLSWTEVPSKPPSAAAGGLRAHSRLLAGGPLSSYHMGLSIGRSQQGSWLSSEHVNERVSKVEARVSCDLLLEVISHTGHYQLPLRMRGLTQGHWYQEVGKLGATLEAAYHTLKLPFPTHALQIPPLKRHHFGHHL